MLGAVPIGTCLTLLTDILPSVLGREIILRIENGITSKGYHQSTIPLLHLAQLFRQIDELIAMEINMELLEVSDLCRQFTLLVVPFPIITSDTMPRA